MTVGGGGISDAWSPRPFIADWPGWKCSSASPAPSAGPCTAIPARTAATSDSGPPSATVITAAGETLERTRDDLVFGYRESSLDEAVILEATLALEEDDPRELAKRMQKQWIIKRANQPLGHQCAGCIFKNPRGASAGELIEKSGLKGTRIGGAVVSERHANFIIAEPDCTSQDVLR